MESVYLFVSRGGTIRAWHPCTVQSHLPLLSWRSSSSYPRSLENSTCIWAEARDWEIFVSRGAVHVGTQQSTTFGPWREIVSPCIWGTRLDSLWVSYGIDSRAGGIVGRISRWRVQGRSELLEQRLLIGKWWHSKMPITCTLCTSSFSLYIGPLLFVLAFHWHFLKYLS